MPRQRKDSEENSNSTSYDDDDDSESMEHNNNNNSSKNPNKNNKSSRSKKLHKLYKPVQRSAANARERSRMRVLSKAFSKLKTTLPWVPPDTKLSKLDTLRLASSYIGHLRQILDVEDEGHRNTFIHPLNLTWPFTFNGRALNETKSPDHIKCSNKAEGTIHG
ncbi:transcription factor 21-like [Littorina saxatilis]|uniref:BHLH domain-containing protein n=1 Tax=Littorina saxatilis TaxID=31220 RepID=A0AAN9GB88_9CAEN